LNSALFMLAILKVSSSQHYFIGFWPDHNPS
jgi:hypothetical protein